MRRFADLVDPIATRGWAVSSGLVSDSIVAELLSEARALWLADGFVEGSVGRAEGRLMKSAIRGDSIRWISGEPATRSRAIFFDAVEELRELLNRELFLGLRSFEAQYAVFPAGAFYETHVDRFSSSDERAISCLLYLNRDWSDEDGGALRLHVEGGPVDVVPRGGTFVVFRSELVEHEVLTARRERFSLTGWFRRSSLRDVLEGRSR